jgi:hypothetical protein
MITLGIVGDWENDPWLDAYRRQCAWGEWAKHCCVEWNGNHSWWATLCDVEDGGYISLTCENCPADIDDLVPDGIDSIWGEVDGIPIASGKHRSLLPYEAPVNAQVKIEHHNNWWLGEDWDVSIQVSPR